MPEKGTFPMLRKHSQGLTPASQDMGHSRRSCVLAALWATLRRLQWFEAYVRVYKWRRQPTFARLMQTYHSSSLFPDLVKYSPALLSHRKQYTQRQELTKLRYIHYGLQHLRNHPRRQLPFLRKRLEVCTGPGLSFCPQHSLLMKVVTERWRNAEIVAATVGCQYRARNSPAGKLSSQHSGDGDEYKEA